MKRQLFLIGGASGSGKTAICRALAGKIKGVICLDGDTLWHPQVFNMENTKPFYDLWFKLADEIASNNVAVAIFHAGLGLPDNLTEYAKDIFEIHYLTLYCSEIKLEERLRNRLEWKNAGSKAAGFINAMKGMNLKYKALPADINVDTSDISLEESSLQVKNWIISTINDRE